MKKKLGSLLIAIMMIMTMIPSLAFADTCNHEWRSDDAGGSCTEGRWVLYWCEKCDEFKTVTDEPTEHNWVFDGTDGFCTDGGSMAYYTCTVCEEELIKEFEATDHIWGDWEVDHKVQVEDGTSYGYRLHYCEACGVCEGEFFGEPEKIKLSTSTYTYDGKTKKPSVKVYDIENKLIDSSNYTVTYASGRKNVGKYKVTVKFIGDYYEGSLSTTFKINPKGTSISKLSKAKKGFTVKWKKQSSKMSKSRIDGYQVRYSTSSKMTNAKKVTVKGYSATSKKISKLKAKKTYYVQVRTYETVKGVKYYSTWSNAKKVKTK